MRSICKDTLVGVCVSYPSPMRSVCEGYGSYSLPMCSICEEYGSYPEHVYTWEGYSNRSVSSCVCVCVST